MIDPQIPSSVYVDQRRVYQLQHLMIAPDPVDPNVGGNASTSPASPAGLSVSSLSPSPSSMKGGKDRSVSKEKQKGVTAFLSEAISSAATVGLYSIVLSLAALHLLIASNSVSFILTLI